MDRFQKYSSSLFYFFFPSLPAYALKLGDMGDKRRGKDFIEEETLSGVVVDIPTSCCSVSIEEYQENGGVNVIGKREKFFYQLTEP